MMKHTWLVAFLACLSLSTLFAGCGDVESCREGTLGCINTAPRANGGGCLFDLVERAGKCVKPGSDDDKCGLCAAGSLCLVNENRCADFCAVPLAKPGSVKPPPATTCEAFIDPTMPGVNPMLSFSEVCTRRCRLRCERLAQFCPGYQCPAGSCDGPDVQARCAMDCPMPAAGGQDLACLTRFCNDARLSVCDSSITCPNGVPPACSALTCTNDCAYEYLSKAVVGDTICDDGEVLSSMSNFCPWGSDCADCGPRTGTVAPAPQPLGELCLWGTNCAGATGLPSTADAWCVLLETTDTGRCLPDCSRGQDCADGFECRSISFTDPQTMMMSAVPDGDLSSAACVPKKCP